MLGNVMAVLTNLRNISATTLQIQLAQLQKMGTVFYITKFFYLFAYFCKVYILKTTLYKTQTTEAKMPTLLARLFTYDNQSDVIRIGSA